VSGTNSGTPRPSGAHLGGVRDDGDGTHVDVGRGHSGDLVVWRDEPDDGEADSRGAPP
jgi:hypothetical protein